MLARKFKIKQLGFNSKKKKIIIIIILKKDLKYKKRMKKQGSGGGIYKKIGCYSLIKEIGVGSFARVFKAKHESKEEEYAVKMISKNLLNEDFLEMIEKEIQILLTLNHPNIIKLLDFKKTSNNWYLIFEYCELGDLE